jgi:malate dehydrogenase
VSTSPTGKPVKVAVTGAAGQIGYSLLFRSPAAPARSGHPGRAAPAGDHAALKTLEGVVMELDDCAFATLDGVEIGDDPGVVFDGANLALLVGARPRTKGMERGDLLEANGAIFTTQGKALNESPPTTSDLRHGQPGEHQRAHRDDQRPDIPQERFAASPASTTTGRSPSWPRRPGARVTDIKKMTIWGNHSATQYPDLFHAEVQGQNAAEVVGDQSWIENEFIPPSPSAARPSSRPAGSSSRERRARRPSTPPATG